MQNKLLLLLTLIYSPLLTQNTPQNASDPINIEQAAKILLHRIEQANLGTRKHKWDGERTYLEKLLEERNWNELLKALPDDLKKRLSSAWQEK